MIRLKNYFKNLSPKNTLLCLGGIVGMGFFLSLLLRCNYGTDTYSFMNTTISKQLGISFGTWQMSLNFLMLLLVIVFNRKLIGIGTIFNMVLLGYLADFFGWIWDRILPASVFTDQPLRAIVFVVSILAFVFFVAIYNNADVGVGSYDAMAFLLDAAFPKVPFFILRICLDYTPLIIAVLLGGRPTIGHFVLSLLLGPAVSLLRTWMGKKS